MLTISGIGRLGQEPKMQYSDKGTAITNLSVAATCGFGDNQETVWVSLVAFGSQAEVVKKYFAKGLRIVFTAEVQKIRTYEKKDNTTGTTLDARLLTFAFVDKSEGGEEDDDF